MNYKPGQIATAPNGNKWVRRREYPGTDPAFDEYKWEPAEDVPYRNGGIPLLTDLQVEALGLTVTGPPDEGPSMVEWRQSSNLDDAFGDPKLPDSFKDKDLIVIRRDRAQVFPPAEHTMNGPIHWRKGDTVIVIAGGGS